MSSLIVVLLSALGGALTTLVPVVALSDERRLLRSLEEAAKAVKAIDDPTAALTLVEGMRSTAGRYARVAGRSPLEQANRRFFFASPLFFVALLAVASALAADSLADSKSGQNLVFWLSLAVGIPAMSVITVLLVGVIIETLASRRELEESQKRVQQLNESQTSILQAADELFDHERESDLKGEFELDVDRLQSDPEVVELLAALERSVDAAKAARTNSDLTNTTLEQRAAERGITRERMRQIEHRERMRRPFADLSADESARAAVARGRAFAENEFTCQHSPEGQVIEPDASKNGA